jgi:hypothetical protein
VSIDLLADTATDLFRRHSGPEVVAAGEREGWSPGLWSELEKSGLARVGAEGEVPEAAAVVRAAARFAAPVPLAETVLAAWLLGDVPEGPLSVAYGGRAGYGRVARAIVVGADLLEPDRFKIVPDVNLAGEPWDRIDPPGDGDDVLLKGALVRSVQLAGALERILELTVAYAQDRRQFGSPILRFQAVQQQLAVMAGEVAAAGAAVDAAVEDPSEMPVAVAKIRAGMAAGEAAAIAHQVHGAIGFTEEHELHHFTRRLWSWRDDFGTEQEWAARLGRTLGAAGAGLWEVIS